MVLEVDIVLTWTWMETDLTESLKVYLPVVLVVLGAFSFMLWIQIYIDSLFRILKKKKMKYLDSKVIENFELLFFYLLFLVTTVSVLFFSAHFLPELASTWRAIASNLKFGIAAFGVGLVALVVGSLIDSISRYYRKGEPFTTSLINLLFFIMKYTIYSVALIVIILLELAFLGWETIIGTYLSNFFVSNLANIIFLIIFVVISWFVFNMITSYIENVYASERRSMPEVYNFILNSIRYIFGLMLMVVIVFTLLSMAGLQPIGYLVIGLIIIFVIVIIYIFGSGAGKEIVSGILFMYNKPFEIGDKLLIDGIIYTIQDLGLVQAMLRTTEGVFITIPNSKLISSSIINLSRSKKQVVEATITLDPKIPLDRIRSIATAITSQSGEIEEIVVDSTTGSEKGIVYTLKIVLPLGSDTARIRTEVIRSFINMTMEG